MTEDAKSFIAEVDAIDKEIKRTHCPRFRDWLRGLRARLLDTARMPESR